MVTPWNDQNEWLEADGLGGYACGTVGGIRTRRYHGLLVTAATPPTNRFMLLNTLEASVETSQGVVDVSSHRYDGQVVHPDGYKRVTSFTNDPWPTWRFVLPDGNAIEQQILMRHGAPNVGISWKLLAPPRGPMTLRVRPLMSGRDFHALHHENPDFNFHPVFKGESLQWHPYGGGPFINVTSKGHYQHVPVWYRGFLYQEEWLRGFDALEDLASPGIFTFALAAGEAAMVWSAGDAFTGGIEQLRSAELARRRGLPTPLHRAADQYIVRRGAGKSIIAGYPWFGDWGRDTFVSLRGLCLSSGRRDVAEQILTAWAPYVSKGMLPNRFPDHGEEPEYNTVDAALWYVIAVYAFLESPCCAATRDTLLTAVQSILDGYSRGTRHGIAADSDGLLRCGEPGVQLTWMDARVGQHVITPRTGKPVEIQALWLNALYLASQHQPRWGELYRRGRDSFCRRFWNDATGTLFDVVDCDHVPRRCDGSLRPNQIFAVGGLPLMLLDHDRARRVVDIVEAQLWTPIGLRSLAPTEAAYAKRYTGGPAERDAVYHQGTVWPWLAGPFVEAWVRVRGSTSRVKSEARRRFVEPLFAHLSEAGIGHVSEIADAEAPHMPRGCPFQAWSLAELLRLETDVLRDRDVKPPRREPHQMLVTS